MAKDHNTDRAVLRGKGAKARRVAQVVDNGPKSTIASIMRGCSEDAARAVERAPKAEAVAQATRELDGKDWLPAPLTLPNDDDAGDDSTADAMQIAAE